MIHLHLSYICVHFCDTHLQKRVLTVAPSPVLPRERTVSERSFRVVHSNTWCTGTLWVRLRARRARRWARARARVIIGTRVRAFACRGAFRARRWIECEWVWGVQARAHPGGGGGGVRHGEAAAAAAREEAAERGSHLRSRALSLLPMEDRTAHAVAGEDSRSPKRDRLDHRVPSDQNRKNPLSSLHCARAVNVLLITNNSNKRGKRDRRGILPVMKTNVFLFDVNPEFSRRTEFVHRSERVLAACVWTLFFFFSFFNFFLFAGVVAGFSRAARAPRAPSGREWTLNASWLRIKKCDGGALPLTRARAPPQPRAVYL